MKKTLLILPFLFLYALLPAQEIFFSSGYPAQTSKINQEQADSFQDITWEMNDSKNTGMFVDGKNKHIYLTIVDDFFGEKKAQIVRTDLDGNNGIVLVDEGIDQAYSPIMNPENPDYLYFINVTFNFDYTFRKLDLATNVITDVFIPARYTPNIVIDFESNTLYYLEYNFFNNIIFKIDLAQDVITSEEFFVEKISREYSQLTFDPATKDFYAVADYGSSVPDDIVQIKNGATASETVFTAPGTNSMVGLAINADDQKLYFNFKFQENVFEIDFAGEGFKVLVSQNDFPNQYQAFSIEHIAINTYFVSKTSDYLSDSKNIKLWPNPNQGNFTIELTDNFSRTNSSYEIINQLGERIHQGNFKSAKFQFNQALATGVYFLKLSNTESALQSITKFVVQ